MDQKELLQTQKTSSQQIKRTLSNLSNEWRQPISHLSSQILYLQTLQRFGNDTQIVHELNKMLPNLSRSIEKMNETMNLFCDFYHDYDKISTFHPKENVANIISMHIQHIILHNIDTQIDCPKDLKIHCYKNSFDNMLMILLENAIESFAQFPVKHARITIRFEQQKHNVWMHFCDNGHGICATDIKKIFDPTFTTKQNSSGLGLSVAKAIAKERFNASLDVVSNDNTTCFSLCLC
ncbi:MAG: sensor histidine kinase [Campylobacterota bacterium]